LRGGLPQYSYSETKEGQNLAREKGGCDMPVVEAKIEESERRS